MNIEDGIALADAELRAAFAHHYSEAWGHVQAREHLCTMSSAFI